MRNSSVTFSEQLMSLYTNLLTAMNAITKVVVSNESQITFETKDATGNSVTASLPSVGYLQSEIEMLRSSLNTLAGVDQRGAVLQTARNSTQRIIVSDTNREPNPVSELGLINSFYSGNNHFFESLLNPLLKIRLDLTGKVEANTRKIRSRRYIIDFEVDDSGEYTPMGQRAIESFNENFKNKSNISLAGLEKWISETPGIAASNHGSKIDYDEQDFDLEPNRLQYEGFFTILGTDEDVVNRKLWYVLDTLDYFEIDTKTKQNLKLGDVLVINSQYATTKFKIIEINTDASDIRVRFEQMEGREPMPIGIVGGLKLFSALVDEKKVEITIGFNEYNVLFIKPINTDNHVVARKWSNGTAFYTNNLNLVSDNTLGDNGKNMTEYYIQSVSDFGALLKDMVTRQIPRSLGIQPTAPELVSSNARVVQINKHLTNTPALEANRKRHSNVNTNRSKVEEITKSIEQKQKELTTREFKQPKDKQAVRNQIEQLTKQKATLTESIASTVQEIIANSQNDSSAAAKYRVQLVWSIPKPQTSTKTLPQHVIAFRVQYKYSSKDGQESTNEIFNVMQDGTPVNALFPPWETIISDIRERVFDPKTQTWSWATPNLSDIDKPSINMLSLAIQPGERIEIRVKSISEVGYPDALLESEWSNTLEVSFPDALLNGRDPQLAIQKSAELEAVRSRILSDISTMNIDLHLSDSFTAANNRYFPHTDENIAHRQPDGTFIPVREKLTQLEGGTTAETDKELVYASNWSSYGGDYDSLKFYKNNKRVFLSGAVRVDTRSTNLGERFPDLLIDGDTNSQYAIIAVLPEGYRPYKNMLFVGLTTNNNYATILVDNCGNIAVKKGRTSFISLNGISFRI